LPALIALRVYDDAMAKKTITTYEHSCDLCGKIQEEAELASLWAPSPRPAASQMYDQLDICAECRKLPIDVALEFFKLRHAAGKGSKVS
jgi:hypothetical protein